MYFCKCKIKTIFTFTRTSKENIMGIITNRTGGVNETNPICDDFISIDGCYFR